MRAIFHRNEPEDVYRELTEGLADNVVPMVMLCGIMVSTGVYVMSIVFSLGVLLATAFRPDDRSGLSASTRNDVWIDRTDFTDRVTLETAGRLRRADGSPLPVTPVDRAELDPDAYDLRYVRGFRGARGHTASGLEVSLTPHAGLGVGSEGRSAEAGVTLKIGEGLDRLAPNGHERFGERPRWYLYAAGSGRAVGYNFARTRDGDYARSGYTQDKGSFLGDASIGVAYRKGDMQTSFGVVYREIDAGKGLASSDFRESALYSTDYVRRFRTPSAD